MPFDLHKYFGVRNPNLPDISASTKNPPAPAQTPQAGKAGNTATETSTAAEKAWNGTAAGSSPTTGKSPAKTARRLGKRTVLVLKRTAKPLIALAFLLAVTGLLCWLAWPVLWAAGVTGYEAFAESGPLAISEAVTSSLSGTDLTGLATAWQQTEYETAAFSVFLGALLLIDLIVLVSSLRNNSTPPNPILDALPAASKGNEYGCGKWLRKPSEITREKDIVAFSVDSMNRKARGIYLGMAGRKVFTYDTDEHMLLLAPTRTGKTRRVLLEMLAVLAEAGENVVTFDPKGELYGLTSDLYREKGYEINRIDLADPAHGNWWNPLYRAIEAYREIEAAKEKDRKGSDVSLFAKVDQLKEQAAHGQPQARAQAREELLETQTKLDMLIARAEREVDRFIEAVAPRGEKESQASAFYADGCENVLRLVIHYVISAPLCPEQCMTPATVSEVASNYLSVEKLVPSDRTDSRSVVPLFELVRALPAQHPAYRMMTKLSTSATYLAEFANEAVQKLGGVSSTDLNQMMEGTDWTAEQLEAAKTVTYIIIPTNATNSMKQLVVLYVTQLYSALQEMAQTTGNRLDRRFNVICEELGNLPPIPNLAEKLSFSGGMGFRWVLVLQDISQLDAVYGKDDRATIVNNCKNQEMLASNDLETARLFSERCGTYTIEKASASSSRDPLAFMARSVSNSVTVAERRLATPDEFTRWRVDYGAVLLRSGSNPIAVPVPDPSTTDFNEILGLGGVAHNEKKIAEAKNVWAHHPGEREILYWGPEVRSDKKVYRIATSKEVKERREAHLTALKQSSRKRQLQERERSQANTNPKKKGGKEK